LSDRGRYVGVLNLLVDSGRELTERTLNELALGEACSQEDSVDTQKNPRALAECQSGEEEADPQQDLKLATKNMEVS